MSAELVNGDPSLCPLCLPQMHTAHANTASPIHIATRGRAHMGRNPCSCQGASLGLERGQNTHVNTCFFLLLFVLAIYKGLSISLSLYFIFLLLQCKTVKWGSPTRPLSRKVTFVALYCSQMGATHTTPLSRNVTFVAHSQMKDSFVISLIVL